MSFLRFTRAIPVTSAGRLSMRPGQGAEEGRRREGSAQRREKHAPIEVTDQANLDGAGHSASLRSGGQGRLSVLSGLQNRTQSRLPRAGQFFNRDEVRWQYSPRRGRHFVQLPRLRQASWSQTPSFTVVTKQAGKRAIHLAWDTEHMQSWMSITDNGTGMDQASGRSRQARSDQGPRGSHHQGDRGRPVQRPQGRGQG